MKTKVQTNKAQGSIKSVQMKSVIRNQEELVESEESSDEMVFE